MEHQGVALNWFLDYIQPAKYIVSSSNYDDKFRTPVLTPGKSFIKGYTDEVTGIFKDVPVIIFDDFTTASRFVNFPFKVKSSAMKILKPRTELVNLKYVFFAMQIINVRSDTHKRYWISIYSKIEIPIAPLPEQRAIVSKIEQLFSELDHGIANLKAAQTKLETYRQAVLKKAFEGELTNSQPELSINERGWQTFPLKDLAQVADGPFGSNLKSKDYVSDGVRVVRLENIGHLEFRNEKKSFVTHEKYQTIKKHTVRGGDIVFSSFISDQIRVTLIPVHISFAINKADCFSIKPNTSLINNKYLCYNLSSKSLYNQLAKKVHGATRPRINTKELKGAQIPVPSVEEQLEIVQEIESRLSVCDKLSESIDQSLEQATALRQSILKKAFAGELLSAKELEACKKEPDWEPAEKLVERIERGEPKQKEKPKKKKLSSVAKKEMSATRKHAALICKIVRFHDEHPKYSGKLGHVKCEKIAHLVESHLGIDLGRKPVKDAAGPDDFNHLKKVESHAQKANLFHTVKKEIGYSYRLGRQGDKVISQFESTLPEDKLQAINQLVKDFGKFDKEDAEIPATLFAAWNNLLLDGKKPTDEEIVTEARENWSEQKMKIKRIRFFNALSWMREKGYIPKGTGMKVLSRRKNK